MSTSQHFKTTFKCNLTCIFLSLTAKLKKPLCPRTPCTSSQKVGDLFFPVIFLDFWTFAVWPHQDWETVIANDSMISDSKVYFALSVGCKTLHLRHSMLMSYYVDYGNMGY